jgi:hypothetical protein
MKDSEGKAPQRAIYRADEAPTLPNISRVRQADLKRHCVHRIPYKDCEVCRLHPPVDGRYQIVNQPDSDTGKT